MNYQEHYNRLMNRGSLRFIGHDKLVARKNIGFYVERHRILPGCLGGEYVVENIAWLTPEEHYVAHQLLVKMYPGNRELMYAAKVMCAKAQDGTKNKLYGWLKRRYSQLGHSAETKAKIRSTCLNRPPVSEETKVKLRKARAGRVTSQETRQKMSVAHKGRQHQSPSTGTRLRIGKSVKRWFAEHDLSSETKQKLSAAANKRWST
jgi:hypothetical protein